MEEHGNRVRCVSDELAEFSTPVLPDGDGGLFITLNAKQLRSKQWQEGQELFLQLSPEPSSYGIPVSEAFLVTMHADPKADELFHQLTPGKQRTLIHWVDQVKSEDIRIRRAMVVMEHLQEVEGKLDFKRLNARIKEVNARYKRG